MSKVTADQLLAEHEPALRNFLGARCRDADLTAEMLQEVAARLVTAAPRITLNGNARGYLFRVAANVWHDHLRHAVVHRRWERANQLEESARVPAADERLLEPELRLAGTRRLGELPRAPRGSGACASGCGDGRSAARYASFHRRSARSWSCDTSVD